MSGGVVPPAWRLPGALAVLFGAALLLPQATDGYLLGVALTFFMWVGLAESWIVLSGLTGYLSLGHVVFFGMGSYVMVLSWQQLPMPIAILCAGFALVPLALVLGFPCLRVRGPYFVILTFGVAEFIKFVVVSIEAGMGKSGRLIFGAPGLVELYYWIVGLALTATVLAYLICRSRFGAGLRAIREDETAAETVGVPVARLKLAAYVVSAVIPGMIGAVMVLRSTYFETLHVFNPLTSFTIVTIAIIGGSDDVPGPLLGAAFLVLLSELLWVSAPELYMIILGTLLIFFVLGAPDGLYGRLGHWLARWRS